MANPRTFYEAIKLNAFALTDLHLRKKFSLLFFIQVQFAVFGSDDHPPIDEDLEGIGLVVTKGGHAGHKIGRV